MVNEAEIFFVDIETGEEFPAYWLTGEEAAKRNVTQDDFGYGMLFVDKNQEVEGHNVWKTFWMGWRKWLSYYLEV